MRNVILTGSRAFGVAHENSDTDYVTLYDPLVGEQWVRGGYDIDDGFIVFSRFNGRQNLILATSMSSYRCWMEAHRHCLMERPRCKLRRKVIFDHYMYGTPLNLKNPLPRECRPFFMKKAYRRGTK